MLQSPETQEGAEAYWYARVLGIYHANVWLENSQIHSASDIRKMDFLWVRWFGAEPDYHSSFHHCRLPKIGFVESTDEFAFGFVDPANVIRGAHLIPAFSIGKGTDLLPRPDSAARSPGDTEDWLNFYVNMYVTSELLL